MKRGQCAYDIGFANAKISNNGYKSSIFIVRKYVIRFDIPVPDVMHVQIVQCTSVSFSDYYPWLVVSWDIPGIK